MGFGERAKELHNRNIHESLDYFKGYSEGYKAGLHETLEYLVKKEQLKADVKMIIKHMESI